MGYAVICPHMNSALMDGVVPDGMFLAGDREFIRRMRAGDVFVLLPGWQESARDEGRSGAGVLTGADHRRVVGGREETQEARSGRCAHRGGFCVILRDYQRNAVDRVKAALDKRPILVAPTGSGKTVMAVALVQELGLPTLWLAHRKELIDQAASHLQSLGLWCGRIMSGYPTEPLAPVQVASVQTLVRRAMPPAKLIIIDESHHATAGSYSRVLENYPNASVAGLTATPFRLDGRGLGDVFGEIVVAAYSDDLCKAGVLHDPKVYAGKSPTFGA